jgi:hypothetical protein
MRFCIDLAGHTEQGEKVLSFLEYASREAERRVATPAVDIEDVVAEGIFINLISKLDWEAE